MRNAFLSIIIAVSAVFLAKAAMNSEYGMSMRLFAVTPHIVIFLYFMVVLHFVIKEKRNAKHSS